MDPETQQVEETDVDLDETATGSPPETDDEPSPDEPEEALETSESDEPSSEEEDAEPAEWASLAKKFEHIQDEAERKREIGKQYWEKTRYASQIRKENEELKRQLEEATTKRVETARREEEKPEELPPHPDLERLDSRINSLTEKDNTLYEQQQKTLVRMGKTNEEIAAAKAYLENADEIQRAVLEQRLEGLEERKGSLEERFYDLKDRRDDLEYRLEELNQQREFTANILSEQGKREASERQSREAFQEEFPQQVFRTIDELADAAGLDPEDEALREDLRSTVKDRLTVKFWKLGQGHEVDDADVDELINAEVQRYIKSRDLGKRKAFKETSKEKLSVSGARRPSSTSKGKPAGRKPASGYEAEPRDVTALGTVDQAPSMARGRKYLERRGL